MEETGPLVPVMPVVMCSCLVPGRNNYSTESFKYSGIFYEVCLQTSPYQVYQGGKPRSYQDKSKRAELVLQ